MNQQTPLYPLKFRPRFVPKMWGGRRLSQVLDKPLPPDEPIGESWELYDFPPAVIEGSDNWTSAEVANGPLQGLTLHDLMMQAMPRLLGQVRPVDTPAGPQFPILIKFLDADQDLSVQVHPDAAYAASHEGAHLKNEAWFVIAHEANARLLKGLRHEATRERFEQAIREGTVEDLLVSLPAHVGEVHYLPSGTVHALGAGMLVAEVQTPSDTTYRVFDFQRIDPKTGQERELHVKQAMECIDFDSAGQDPFPPVSGDGIVVQAPQFSVEQRTADGGESHLPPAGVPTVLIFLEGSGSISGDAFETVPFRKGDTILLPAELAGHQMDVGERTRWLETSFPT